MKTESIRGTLDDLNREPDFMSSTSCGRAIETARRTLDSNLNVARLER